MLHVCEMDIPKTTSQIASPSSRRTSFPHWWARTTLVGTFSYSPSTGRTISMENMELDP